MSDSESTSGADPQRSLDDADHTATRLSKDDAFHLLQSGRRRAVLRYLVAHEAESGTRMRDLAEAVAAWENETTVARLTSAQRQRVYIALYQSHLPKLDEYGVIDYNQSRGVIRPQPELAILEPFLGDGSDDAEWLTPPADESETSVHPGVIATVENLFGR